MWPVRLMLFAIGISPDANGPNVGMKNLGSAFSDRFAYFGMLTDIPHPLWIGIKRNDTLKSGPHRHQRRSPQTKFKIAATLG